MPKNYGVGAAVVADVVVVVDEVVVVVDVEVVGVTVKKKNYKISKIKKTPKHK